MRQFSMQAGCVDYPWNGRCPDEIIIRMQAGRSGRGMATVDYSLIHVPIEDIDAARKAEREKSETPVLAVPLMFGYRPSAADCDGYVVVYPAPVSDFSAGWAYRE
ncbi:MAG TPA: hypothetical protein VLL82_12900 [Mycobacterium sp.]|nr:hypothetical protein [Mycobacterium sp.]